MLRWTDRCRIDLSYTLKRILSYTLKQHTLSRTLISNTPFNSQFHTLLTAYPLTRPLTQPLTRPPTQPLTRPPTQPLTRPPTQPLTRPLTQPLTRPLTQPLTLPPTQPLTRLHNVGRLINSLRGFVDVGGQVPLPSPSPPPSTPLLTLTLTLTLTYPPTHPLNYTLLSCNTTL